MESDIIKYTEEKILMWYDYTRTANDLLAIGKVIDWNPKTKKRKIKLILSLAVFFTVDGILFSFLIICPRYWSFFVLSC